MGKRFPLDTQIQSLWLPAIQAQWALNGGRKNPAAALNKLQAATSVELGEVLFAINVSCLYPVYVRGEANLAAGQGTAAAAELQKILDHSGIVWNCWTGALSHLGVARANALQARISQGADADAARVRALAVCKDFLALWKDADPDIPILKQTKAEYTKLQESADTSRPEHASWTRRANLSCRSFFMEVSPMITLQAFVVVAASLGFLAPFAIGQTAAPVCNLNQPAPMLPLHTNSRYIVDNQNHRFKLSGAAWYGAESKDFVPGGLQLEPLHAIVRRIRCMGFNSVRLPWSNEMYESNPVVPDYAVTANPDLKGLHALDIYDVVVRALAAQGLLVILDNHNSNAEWCCGNDGNQLWYNADYPEASWIADWKAMVARYKSVPQVVGADLRNEPRITATWGGDPSTDWHAAAERGGDAVLSVNPHLLIMVEGVNYALDLTGVASLPVELSSPNRLVYSAHDYPFDHGGLVSASQLAGDLDAAWGYIVTPGQSYTAPVWVGEFGNCHTSSACITDTTSSDGSGGLWFASIRQYLANNDIDWSWWVLNGTETTGSGRVFGGEETYGILNPYWNAPAIPNELQPPPTMNTLSALQTIAQPDQGPEIDDSFAPLAALTLPLPGTTIVSGTAATISADVNLRAGSSDFIQKVDFFAGGAKIGSATSFPYSIVWQNVPAGSYMLQARATTTSGHVAITEPIPMQALNYVTHNPGNTSAISVNFVSYAVTPMAPAEIAGVIPVANWNQAGIANSGQLNNLVDQRGKPTSASVTWSATNTYATSIPDQPGNNRMMKGYLDDSNTRPNTVFVTGLPASFGVYDVYVYFDGANGSATRTSNYRLTSIGGDGLVHGCAGQMEEGSTITGTDAGGVDFSGTFFPATGGSQGNYVEFLNCTGSSFSLAPVHGGSTDSQVRAPVNGIQIVAHD